MVGGARVTRSGGSPCSVHRGRRLLDGGVICGSGNGRETNLEVPGSSRPTGYPVVGPRRAAIPGAFRRGAGIPWGNRADDRRSARRRSTPGERPYGTTTPEGGAVRSEVNIPTAHFDPVGQSGPTTAGRLRSRAELDDITGFLTSDDKTGRVLPHRPSESSHTWFSADSSASGCLACETKDGS